jgi:adenylylsulfate kinase-like enzyme
LVIGGYAGNTNPRAAPIKVFVDARMVCVDERDPKFTYKIAQATPVDMRAREDGNFLREQGLVLFP